MSKPYIKDGGNSLTDALDICDLSGEKIHPNEWTIYKFVGKNNKFEYMLGLDHWCIKTHGCIQFLKHHSVVSDNDTIDMQISDDNQSCVVFTKNYKYMFKKTDEIRTIKSQNGWYNETVTELVSVSKFDNTSLDDIPKYHLELDSNILNFYQNGEYVWSKLISLKYTSGVYFLLRDKIFAVIENGRGHLECFNFDGTLFKTFSLDLEYIKGERIIDDKYIKIRGFLWGPIYLKQIIQIDSFFKDKLKYKCMDEDEDSDNFDSDELCEED